MLRVDTRPKRKNAPRPFWKVCESFRQWLRGRKCACGGRNPHCGGPMVAAHVDYAAKGTPDAKGAATKVADRWTFRSPTSATSCSTRKAGFGSTPTSWAARRRLSIWPPHIGSNGPDGSPGSGRFNDDFQRERIE